MRKGFTLLELLVVLVIISIVAAIVGPRMGGSLSTLNLKTASKKIAATLRYARSQATSESTAYVVLFDLDRDRLTIEAGQVGPNEDKDNEAANEEQGSDQSNEAADGSQDAGQSNERADGTPGRGRSKVYDLPEGVKFEKALSDEDEVDSGIFRIVFLPNGGSSGGEVFLHNDRERRYYILVDFVTGTVRLGEVGAKSSRRGGYSI